MNTVPERDDAGQILALALLFLVALMAIGVSVATYATTSLTSTNSLQSQLDLQTTAQSALAIAVDQFRVHVDDGLPYSGTNGSPETCPLSGSSFDLSGLTSGNPPTYTANGGDKVSVSCVGLDPANGGVDVTSVSGGAFGVASTGLISLPGTPSVTLPGPPNTASTVTTPSLLSTVLELTSMGVTTQETNVPGTSGTATSTASVSNLKVLGVLSANLLGLGLISTACSSTGSGSTASTTATSLTIAGSTVTLPNPLPVDYSITSGLGALTSVEFNVQTSSNTLGSTTITVTGAEITVLGTTLELAQSSCGVSGTNVNAGPDLTNGRRVLFTVKCVSASFGPCPSGSLVSADVEFGDVYGQSATQVIYLSHWTASY